MIFPFLCKTVTACQITVMSNVQAQSLHHCFSLFEMFNGIPINIFCKKHFCIFKLLNLLKSCRNLFFLVLPFEMFLDKSRIFAFIQKSYDVIDQFIYNMYGTAIYIQYNVISIVFITMNHRVTPFFCIFFIATNKQRL